MDYSIGDWVIFDLRIVQITKLGEWDTCSDGSISTSGRLVERFRPLTLQNKSIAESFDYFYNEIRKLDGSTGFNFPDINRYFCQLSLDAIDAETPEGIKSYFVKAHEFVRSARDYVPYIDGVKLFHTTN